MCQHHTCRGEVPTINGPFHYQHHHHNRHSYTDHQIIAIIAITVVAIEWNQLGAFFWTYATSGSTIDDDDIGRGSPVRLVQVADVADDATRILQLFGGSTECQALRVVSLEDKKYLHFEETKLNEVREVSYSRKESYFPQKTIYILFVSEIN